MPNLRIAAFQRRPEFDNVAGTAERVAADLEWCDVRDVDLAVFPECYLQGYASDEQTIARRAFSLDAAVFTGVLDSLASFRVTAILGVVEERNFKFYNSAVVIRHGRVLGAYSKTYPNERGFQAGSDYPIFESAGWRFGINICNDANYPEAAYQVSAQGARLICFPLNNMLPRSTASMWRSKSVENLRRRAVETGCWVVSSDVVGEHGDMTSYGCTCIVRPDGQVIERVSEGTEGAIMLDLTN